MWLLTYRLSEANIESILAEVEKVFGDHSRNGESSACALSPP